MEWGSKTYLTRCMYGLVNIKFFLISEHSKYDNVLVFNAYTLFVYLTRCICGLINIKFFCS